MTTEKKEDNKKDELSVGKNDLQQLLDFISKSLEDTKDGRVVLLPVDSSQNSIDAVEYAAKHFIRESDVVILMTVWEAAIDWVSIYTTANLSVHYPGPMTLGNVNQNMKRQEKLNEKQKKQAKQIIMHLYKDFLKDRKVIPLLIHGPPDTNTTFIGKEIVKIANVSKCNCVIMGTRGLGKIKEFFMGSVSKYVLEHCKVPLLIIPHNDEKSKDNKNEDKKKN